MHDHRSLAASPYSNQSPHLSLATYIVGPTISLG